MNTNTEPNNNATALPLYVDDSEPVVEHTSNTVTYIMLGVGVLFFLLAFYINFFL